MLFADKETLSQGGKVMGRIGRKIGSLREQTKKTVQELGLQIP